MSESPVSEASRMFRTPELQTSVERRTKEVKTSRVYILQAKSSQEIRQDLELHNPGDIYFTNAVLLEKGEGSRNKGDIIPFGGKEKEEDREKAAYYKKKGNKPYTVEAVTGARESFEEAGPTIDEKDMEKVGEIDYVIQQTVEDEGKRVITNLKTHSTCFVTRVSPAPFTAFHVRNRDEDKGAPITLDWREKHRLINTGLLSKEDGSIVRMADGLSKVELPARKATEGGVVQNKLIETDRTKASIILNEVQKKEFEYEIEKSLNVFDKFMEALGLNEEEKKYWQDLFKAAGFNDKGEAVSVTKKLVELKKNQLNFWEKYGKSEYEEKEEAAKQLFCQAVDYSNFEEDVKLARGGEPGAVLRLMFSLLKTRSFGNRIWNEKYLDIAEKSTTPELTSFAHNIKKLFHLLRSAMVGGKKDGQRSIGEKLANDKDDGQNEYEKQIEQVFCESFGIKDSEELHKLLSLVDTMIAKIVIHIKPLLKDKRFKYNLPPQLNQVANSPLSRLLLYSLPLDKEFGEWKSKLRGEGEDFVEQVVYEARRKIALAVYFVDTLRHYEYVTKELKNHKIEKLWEDVFVGPIRRTDLKYTYEKRRVNGEDEEVLENVEIIGNDEKENRDANREGQMITNATLRSFEGAHGRCYGAVETRTKELDSCGRKMIVRGGGDTAKVLMDIYGRSIKLAPASSSLEDIAYLEARETRTINVCSEDTDGVEACGPKAVIDSPAVLDIMERMASKKGVRIFNIKPTGKIESNGPGGGGEIILGKFYLQHKDAAGQVRWEEVQIYSPAEGKSGFYWEQVKKEDDERYRYERLMRALGELFPDDPRLFQDLLTMIHKKKDNGKNGDGNRSTTKN